MAIEDHPRVLVAILALALAAACVGAARTMIPESQASRPPVPIDPQACGLATPGELVARADALPLHEVIAGGVGLGKALSVGLKVDSEAIPAALAEGISSGTVSLKRSATMVLLLRLDAIVGLKATFESAKGQDRLVRVDVTCALCHSSVDDSVLPGIGKRRHGWPNRDLDQAALAALSPGHLKVYRNTMRSRLSEIPSARMPPMAGINSRDGAKVVP
jgi:hypothetical protein